MRSRLYYFSPFDVQRGVAHSIQVMRMCSAFSAIGFEVVLLTPHYARFRDVKNVPMEKLWEFYGLSEKFRVVRFPTLLWENAPAWLELISRSLMTILFLVRHALFGRTRGSDILYSRCFSCSFLLAKLRFLLKKETLLVFELHSAAEGRHLETLKSQDAIVVISEALKRDLTAKGVESERVLVERDAVDLEMIERKRIDKLEARKMLGLPLDAAIICYSGKVGWTEDPLLMIQAASQLNSDSLFLVVGGRPAAQRRFAEIAKRKGVGNIKFVGYVEPSKVIYYHLAADVLVQLHAAASPIHEYFSPLKLFEYMAAKRPIVATDYPTLREFLVQGQDVYFVQPGSALALSEGITFLLQNPSIGNSLAKCAFEKVKAYTWKSRAERIRAFLFKLHGS